MRKNSNRSLLLFAVLFGNIDVIRLVYKLQEMNMPDLVKPDSLAILSLLVSLTMWFVYWLPGCRHGK